MKGKRLFIPSDCEGAVQSALRIRIVYLQSYREESLRKGYPQTAEAIMQDVANLTMIADKLSEAKPE